MKIFDPLEPHGHSEIAIFTVFITLTEPVQISLAKPHIFASPDCPWGSRGRRKGQKRSPKSTHKCTADSVPSPKLPKDSQGSRSRHSGQVGRREYDRNVAEIALDNIKRTASITETLATFNFEISCSDDVTAQTQHRATRMGTAPREPTSKPKSR